MPGSDNPLAQVYILDDNTISQAWLSYHRDIFPSFWERFDLLVRAGSAISVDTVRDELLASRRVAGAVAYLERINPQFFEEPTGYEQTLVDEMKVAPVLSSAVNRWQAKRSVDADPYLVAKGLASAIPATVVTEESQHPGRTASIPYVCRHYGVDCISSHEMMARLGWRF